MSKKKERERAAAATHSSPWRSRLLLISAIVVALVAFVAGIVIGGGGSSSLGLPQRPRSAAEKRERERSPRPPAANRDTSPAAPQPDAAVAAFLADVEPLHRTTPLAAVTRYAAFLGSPPVDANFGPNRDGQLTAAALKLIAPAIAPRDRVHVLEGYATALSLAKRFADAAAVLREALRLRMTSMMDSGKQKKLQRGDAAGSTNDDEGFSSPGDVIAALGSLAAALQDAGAYEDALNVVQQAQTQVAVLGGLTDGKKKAKLSPGLRRVLAVMLKMESGVHGCLGDAVTSLSRWENARAMLAALPSSGSADGGSSSSSGDGDDAELVSDRLNHIDLLGRVIAHEPPPPPGVLEGLRTERDAQIAALIARGPWNNPQQLPKTFVPGLASRPWHSVQDNFPSLAPVEAALTSATASLREEVLRLRERGLLLREHECIHDAAGGSWYHYSVSVLCVRGVYLLFNCVTCAFQFSVNLSEFSVLCVHM